MLASGQTPYPTRFRGFVSSTFPMALGLRVPFTSEWLLGTLLSGSSIWRSWCSSLVLVAARDDARGASAVRNGRGSSRSCMRSRPPRGSSTSRATSSCSYRCWRSSSPRDARRLSAPLSSFVSVALTTFVLWHLSASPAFVERADGLFVPRNFDSLIAYLEAHGPRRVFAGYWIAYRPDFESRERIVAAEATLKTIALRAGRVVRDANRGNPTRTVTRSTTRRCVPIRTPVSSCYGCQPAAARHRCAPGSDMSWRTHECGHCSSAPATSAPLSATSRSTDVDPHDTAFRPLAHGRLRTEAFRRWAILDSNQGPPPYQSGALTD